MITTVTLNAAIDKAYFLPRFSPGTVSRVPRMEAAAGGKGINVARVLHLLGIPVTATGFMGGFNGRWMEQDLNRLGLAHDFQHVEGESRICLNVIDESTAASTELLERGPEISPGDMEAFAAKLARLAARSRLVCFSGSLPRGVPDTCYAELIGIVKREGADVFLDTSGDALKLGIQSAPDLIKPNEEEAAGLIGSPVADDGESVEALKRLTQAAGIRCLVVSQGSEGALVVERERDAYYKVRAPKLQSVNTVGCGDAFVAGLAAAWAERKPLPEALAWAAAAGGANALHPRTGYVRKEDFQALLGKVEVLRIG